MLLTALDFVTALELTPVELVQSAAANSCRSVGLLVHSWGVLPFPDPGLIGNPAACRHLADVCRDLGVAVDMAELFVLDAACDVDVFRPAFDVAAKLGCPRVNTLALDPEPSRLADHYEKFCGLAAEYGMSVLVEVIRMTALGSVTAAVEFLDCFDLTVKIEVDALHFFRYGGQVAEIARNANRIGRAQICDGALQASDAEYAVEALYRRQIPGEGELPLVDFLAALPDGIVVGVEVPRVDLRTQERIRRAVDGCRWLMAQVQDGHLKAARLETTLQSK